MDINHNKIYEYINLKIDEIINNKFNEYINLKVDEIINNKFNENNMDTSLIIDNSFPNLMLTSQIFDNTNDIDCSATLLDNQNTDSISTNCIEDNKLNICNIIENAKNNNNGMTESRCSDISNNTLTKNMTDVININNLIKNIDKETISKISELETKILTMENKYDIILSNVNDELNNIVENLSKNLSSNFDKCIEQKIKPICIAIEVLRDKINTNIIDKLNDKKISQKSIFSL
jgi:hypothetical protein